MADEITQSTVPILETSTMSVSSSPTSGDTAGHIKRLDTIIYGLVIVLFIGFAGMFVAVAAMLVDSYKSRQASYEELKTQIMQQELKIDSLIGQIKKSP